LGESQRHPLANDVGAGGEVTESLAARAGQRGQEGGCSGEHVDLHEADQGPDEGVLEADGSGVVAHRAQAEGQLAERLAAGQRLERRRDDDEDDDRRAEHRHGEQGIAGVDRRGAGDHDDQDQQQDRCDHVDQSGGEPHADSCGRKVERDRFAGDEVIGCQRCELRGGHGDLG
jgi:hypothetical protein